MSINKFLEGGARTGALLRSTDWSQTSLGIPDSWPESLKMSVSISLNSGFPIAIYWGADHTILYNDAYSSIPGDKHPWALGKPGAIAWSEIWDVLDEEFKRVLYSGDSIRRPDALLLMNRYGYTEECYFDYTLSPIIGIDGEIGGVFNAVIETTYKVINDRRNMILQQFLAELDTPESISSGLRIALDVLGNASEDIPFSLIYTYLEGHQEDLHLAGCTGISKDGAFASVWPPLSDILSTDTLPIQSLHRHLIEPIRSYWGEHCSEVLLVPLSKGTKVGGFMVAGVSPRKRLDHDYVLFLKTVAMNIGTLLNNGYAFEQSGLLQREQALNEELAAANEELSAINEALQQTQQSLNELNEELEQRVASRTLALSISEAEQQTLNEELTATNEELLTINEQLEYSQLELQEMVRRLAESESRIRFMVADAPVAIGVVTSREMIIESANNKILEVWGKKEDIIGLTLRDALPEINGQPFLQILDDVYMSGRPYYGNELMARLVRNGDTEEVYFNFVYHPMKDQSGKTVSIMLVAAEVTEQVHSRRLVEASEKRFRFLLNTIPQQVWTAKADGTLDYVNENVANDFGYEANDIVNLGWEKFVHPDDLSRSLNAWQFSLASGEAYQEEFRLLFHDGTYKWHLARALPFIEDGQIKIWMGTNTDIEVQKDNERRKDEFLSIASHELKTPLTSIKAFNQLMKRTTDESRLNGFVQKSSDHILRLEKLISDLLDVSKINAGKLNYTMSHFAFSKMLRDSIESVQHMTSSHEIILESAADVVYTGDQFRLEQVMNNILTNAVKYSPDGRKIIVNCSIEQGNIVVSVQDFGIGIARADLDRLFDRYYRVDNTAMRFEGLGLGLFISSEILKRHKGSFWIESEMGKGSVFYFMLPINKDSAPEFYNQTERYYKNDKLTIVYNTSKKRLDVDWTGYQNMESVKHGCMQMLEMLKVNKCYKVLNDNTNVSGTWSDASEWAGKVWLPLMEEAGLKYFAWIFSPSAFAQLSARKTVDVMEGQIITQFFNNAQEADEWISLY